MSVETKPEDKKTRIAKMRERHQPLFDALGIPNAEFIPKMAYKPTGKDEKHIGFFKSEVEKETDIYIEFASREYEPEDPEHRLYKWKYNPHYKQEYGTTEEPLRYLVPVAELSVVHMPEEPASEEKGSGLSTTNLEFDLTDPETDPPYSMMTLRDYAAIQLRVPRSNKEWLNEMIRESREQNATKK